jgi:hypothetical protein
MGDGLQFMLRSGARKHLRSTRGPRASAAGRLRHQRPIAALRVNVRAEGTIHG